MMGNPSPPRGADKTEEFQSRPSARKLIVLCVMAGDPETSIEAFYEKHHREAYVWARSKLKNRDDALDAVHDAFVKVMRAHERLGGRPMTLPWLYRIVINVCIDRHRKTRRSCEQALDEVTERRCLPRGRFEPSVAYEANEIRAAIGAGIEGLSDQHRTVLVMRELDGMSYEEIAEGINCPEGTVMSRLFHARRKLRHALGKALDLSPGRAAIAA